MQHVILIVHIEIRVANFEKRSKRVVRNKIRKLLVKPAFKNILKIVFSKNRSPCDFLEF